MKLSSIAENLWLRVINTAAFRIVSLVTVAFILTTEVMTTQDGGVRPSKSEAQAAWNKGSYELAYEHYNGLLLLYSRDPLYKYYTGACLVKMEHDIARAVTLLESAINSSVYVKSVPDDVWFYYGRALQLNGSFAPATEAYGSFARATGKKVAAEYEVQTYIDQCSRGQGAFSPVATGAAATATSPAASTTATSPVSTPATTKPATPETTGKSQTLPGDPKPPAGEIANKPPDPAASSMPPAFEAASHPQVPPASDLPVEYATAIAEALRLQHEADSVLQTAGDTAGSATLQARADSIFITLEANEATPSGKREPAEPEMLPPAHLFSDFEVRPSPAYSDKNPVAVDFSIPPGLVYTVQIAAFKNPVAPSLFKNLYPVFGGIRAGSDATYYCTGLFRRLEDVQQALPTARGAGFPDAFVIAMMDGIQVSMERACELEKQWGAIPLPGKDVLIPENDGNGAVSALPVGTLSFRAEVMRISKPVKPEVIEKIELLSGTRGLDMVKNSDGETVFLIGNFITFESADEYVSLLIRNGYSTARVAAYVGMKEIPVEAALELLNKLPDD
jgi:hypothetical protein